MDFALISEGITDQIVLERIIHAHYKNQGDVNVNFLAPLRDATDETRQALDNFGGWEQVFEYISHIEKIDDALQANDYLIIHVDSDICWHESIDIDHAQNCNELIDEIRNLLIEKIKQENYEIFSANIIFAIPIHSTECWLVPLHTKNENQINEQRNCERVLSRINDLIGKTEKNHDNYTELAKPYKKQKDIELVSRTHPSLEKFIQSLPIHPEQI